MLKILSILFPCTSNFGSFGESAFDTCAFLSSRRIQNSKVVSSKEFLRIGLHGIPWWVADNDIEPSLLVLQRPENFRKSKFKC